MTTCECRPDSRRSRVRAAPSEICASSLRVCPQPRCVTRSREPTWAALIRWRRTNPQLHEVQPALSALDIADEGLRAPELLANLVRSVGNSWSTFLAMRMIVAKGADATLVASAAIVFQ